MQVHGAGESITDRVDRLDLELCDKIQSGGTQSDADRRSLLALHAALAARDEFSYLEIGSYLGGSLQALIADPRCSRIVAIDRRDERSPDERSDDIEYPNNTTQNMLEHLSRVPGADFQKLETIDSSTDELDPLEFRADLCFIDAEHTNAAALRDARFCYSVIRGCGAIIFHDRTLVAQGIQTFLGELPRYRAYPLAHDLFVVEMGIASLLDDARVRAQVPRAVWLIADRLHAMRPALRLAAMIRR